MCVSVGRWKCAKWLRLLLSVSVRRTVRRVHGCLAAGAQSGSAEIEMRFSVCPRWNACANSKANAVGTSNRCGCSWKGHPICISLRQVHVCVFVCGCVWRSGGRHFHAIKSRHSINQFDKYTNRSDWNFARVANVETWFQLFNSAITALENCIGYLMTFCDLCSTPLNG